MVDVDGFDLAQLTPGFLADPYPTYRALREQVPVKRMPDGSVFLTRHADLSRVYRDTRSFSSDKSVEFRPKFGDTPLYEHHTTSLVFNDPPRHSRVRRLIAGALTPRAIAGMEAGLTAVVDGLLDGLAARTRVDLIPDFAAAIPIEVIGNLLGVPTAERGPLREWSLAILGALEPVVTTGAAARGNRAVTEFLAYLGTLTADRRARPGDPERDVLTRLLQPDATGDRLTEAELLHNCIFLLNAGHETTTNLIGNGLVALAQHPAERARLLSDPGLIRSAVEEVLRYESSNQLGNRITATPVEIGGVACPAGTPVTLCIGAANRDPDAFADPDRFDIGRSPNRHLAFAAGIHQCAGMSLARLEGAVAIGCLVARFPRYALAGAPVRGMRARFRGSPLFPPCWTGRMPASQGSASMGATGVGRRAVLAGAALLAGRARAQDARVRIGVLTDESGPYASSGGAGSAAAARMAVQDFGGTVLGRPIEVIRADTQNKPDVAGSIAREWYDGGVDAITDLPVTPVAAAVQQVARDKVRTVLITAAAVTEFTSRTCAPVSSHWADDTHALAAGTGKVLTEGGGKTWYFVTVNFSFGEALQAEAARVIEAAGGKVLGGTRFPIGNTDFSSQLVQAQTSGAQVIGLASVGGDQVNLLKQAAEFGMQTGGPQTLAGFLVYLTDIHALGLDVAQGLRFPTSFYWDQNPASRAFGQRFMAERRAMPTQNQANVYAATTHFLRAAAQAGTQDALAVGRAMRALPVGYFGADTAMRADGRVLHDLTLYRVKAPGESKGAWDYLAPVGRVAAGEAFLGINPACA